MTALETAAQDFEPSWRAMPEAEIILIFSSNTEVLNVEDMLEEKDLAFELVPVPKEVNPNCGLAISFKRQVETAVMAALEAAGFNPLAAFMRLGDEFKPREKELLPPAS